MEIDDKQYDFTPRATQALVLAGKEAKRLSHNFIGTEHLILGVVRLGEESSAAQVLKAFDVDLAQIKTETEKHMGQGPEERKGTETPPLTPRTRKVLSLANRERQTLGQTYLGTEHILLGLLREGYGVAARVLRELNVDLEKARQEVLKLTRPLPTTTTGASEKPNLSELRKAAEELLKNPGPRLRHTPRILAALCAVNHIKDDNEREAVFLDVLVFLREKYKK